MEKLLLSDEDKYILSAYTLYLDKSHGYWFVYVNGRKTYLHRLIMKAKKGEIIDHIDRDKNNNKRDNLRLASASLNNYNRSVKNKNGRGIYFDKCGNRYRACISHKNKTLKLGSFKNINDAKNAYNKKAYDIYGENAFLHKI